ncbi:MAG: GntR family transcriptional regulator [Alphaproteobacteria bacterium]|jgi:DNA-binding GntR family transcriptional regulator|nr:MAG: GntR family transcriptional regulator [Alphaproteobacteria bacterium]|tara:strand:+ start:2290 stop:2949 length:660 start_codon:yes stop_codon:yes gene_type:complete
MENIQLSVTENIFKKIKYDIVFGNLEPDQKLKLNLLQKEYNVSISILREVLNRLCGDGFIIYKVQKGFFVSPISKKDLYEIADLRIILETHALEISIKNKDYEWEAELLGAYHKLNHAENELEKNNLNAKSLWTKYDAEFHQMLIKKCNSLNLIRIHEVIFDKYLRYQLLILKYRGKDSIKEHKDLLDYSLISNIQKAQNTLRDHIKKGVDYASSNLSL